MNAFDHFSNLIQQLAQSWGVTADIPVRECTVYFAASNEGEVMLRLADDESVITVGASMPLARLSDAPVERHALQQFLLQRTYAAHLASQVRYVWREESDRIVLYSAVETSEATSDRIIAILANLDARLEALRSAIPVFQHSGQALAPLESMDFQDYA